MTTSPPIALTPEQRAKLARRTTSVFDPASVDLPPLPQVPGMTSDAEGRYLYWLTSSAYAGAGAVVEVGTWLGRSTIHLAAGLRDAGYLDALHCFDQFEWRRSHDTKVSLPLRKGESFQPFFERNVRPVYPSVRVTKTKIRDLTWDRGPIEILFLDAPKSLTDLSSVFAVFGPSLVPGLSLIVFQDYQHFPSYPVPAVVSCLNEELGLLHAIEGGSSVSFEVREVLPFDLAQPTAWNFGRWTKAQASAAWQRVLAPLPQRARLRVSPGLALLLYDGGQKGAACEALREIPRDEEMLAEWRRFAAYPFYEEYRPLFRIVGVPPLPGVRGVLDPLRWRVRQVGRQLVRPARRAAANWLRAAARRLRRAP